MPIYEYRCPEHGVFEQIRPFSESDETGTCPECEAECGRIISLPAIAQGDFGTTPRTVVGGLRKSPKSAYRMEKYVDERLSGKNKGGALQEAIRQTGRKPATDDPGSLGLRNVGDS